MLAGALFAPAAHAAQMPGAGPGHGSVFQLATLPPRTRLRCRMRGVRVRTLARWGRRAPGSAATGRAADANIRPQFSSDGTSARGPPRFRWAIRRRGGAATCRPASSSS